MQRVYFVVQLDLVYFQGQTPLFQTFFSKYVLGLGILDENSEGIASISLKDCVSYFKDVHVLELVMVTKTLFSKSLSVTTICSNYNLSLQTTANVVLL